MFQIVQTQPDPTKVTILDSGDYQQMLDKLSHYSLDLASKGFEIIEINPKMVFANKGNQEFYWLKVK
jgi:hypothetical protein